MAGELPTLAISLYAPWIFAILNFGKDVENRGFSFPRRHTGAVWLHASLFGTRDGNREMLEEFDAVKDMADRAGFDRAAFRDGGPIKLGELLAMRGCIVGRINITGYATTSRSGWAVPGALHIELANPVALATPVSCKGALGLWRVPESVLEVLRRAPE